MQQNSKSHHSTVDMVSRINARVAHLRPSEQRVAQFILTNLSFAAQASINELAEKADVSLASITRFAKALDCDNVRDLKHQLAQAAALGDRFTTEELVETKQIPAIYHAIQQQLGVNAGLIEEGAIKVASQHIVAAKHTLLLGVGGGSSIFAQECQYRLFRLGVNATAYSDPMLMRMTAASVDKGDVVLCLSLGGVSPDVLEAAQIAREYGAYVIVIAPNSELAKLADIHLPISTSEEDYIFTPSTSRYVMLAAIDMLVSDIAVVNQRQSREKLRRIKLHLDEHRQTGQGARLPIGD